MGLHMKYLILFVLLFQLNLFAEKEPTLVIKDSSFAPFLKNSFLAPLKRFSNITFLGYTFELKDTKLEIEEDLGYQLYFNPRQDLNPTLLEVAQNYLGTKVEVITRNGEYENSLEGTLNSLNISISESWSSTSNFTANYYLTAQDQGHSITVGERTIAFADIIEIRLLGRKTIALNDITWIFPPIMVSDRTETTQLKIHTQELALSTFNTSKISLVEQKKIETYSKYFGKKVVVTTEPKKEGVLPKIYMGTVEGVGLTSFSRRGYANDLYTGGYDTSRENIIPNKNYLVLKVGEKTIRIPIHEISSTYVVQNDACPEKMLMAAHLL